MLYNLIVNISYLTKEEYIMEKEFATFAGGCFWCMVPPFEEIPGVLKVTVGFTGGKFKNPSYEKVSMGYTDHFEAIQITYDPEICSYEKLLNIFWQQIDPTDDGGQFVDRGYTYLTAIFYHNDKQKNKAEESKKRLDESGLFLKPIVTEIRPAMPFYPAEDYHQGYHRKNNTFYCQYRKDSGRDEFIGKIWGNKTKSNS